MDKEDLAPILYSMKLNECRQVAATMEVIRVPGGWIYNTYQETGMGGFTPASCFVPFDNEFEPINQP